mgnify:CR=1 FL=1
MKLLKTSPPNYSQNIEQTRRDDGSVAHPRENKMMARRINNLDLHRGGSCISRLRRSIERFALLG